MRKIFLSKIFSFIIIIIIIAFLSWLFVFLYKNFYQSFIQAHKVSILQKEIITETINISLFNKIIQELQTKKNINFPENLNKTKNPFSLYLNSN
jgi:cell shape-determining protein MreC